jgi:hypothetical protein
MLEALKSICSKLKLSVNFEGLQTTLISNAGAETTIIEVTCPLENCEHPINVSITKRRVRTEGFRSHLKRCHNQNLEEQTNPEEDCYDQHNSSINLDSDEHETHENDPKRQKTVEGVSNVLRDSQST